MTRLARPEEIAASKHRNQSGVERGRGAPLDGSEMGLTRSRVWMCAVARRLRDLPVWQDVRRNGSKAAACVAGIEKSVGWKTVWNWEPWIVTADIYWIEGISCGRLAIVGRPRAGARVSILWAALKERRRICGSRRGFWACRGSCEVSKSSSRWQPDGPLGEFLGTAVGVIAYLVCLTLGLSLAERALARLGHPTTRERVHRTDGSER